MARGILGDDGPTIWMLIACILFWGKIKEFFTGAGDSLKGNLANPLQTETTEQIRTKEKAVAAVKTAPSKLPKPLAFYQQIADMSYSELLAWFNVDEEKLIALVRGLSANELKTVYKCFGVRDNKVLGLAQSTLNLVEFYNGCLSDGWTGNDLSTMKAIWKDTGLW